LGKEFDSNLKEFIDFAAFQNINSEEEKELTDKNITQQKELSKFTKTLINEYEGKGLSKQTNPRVKCNS
jgi:hypothetical protein